MKTLLLACLLSISTRAQVSEAIPRFGDFPETQILRGVPARPILVTSAERRYRTVISQGVTKGWGAEDGITGKPLAAPGPNFAGHYLIVTRGCGSPCLMAAIVNLKSGRVLPPPYHRWPGHSYFAVPWEWPAKPMAYRLDSRLLIMNICEAERKVWVDGRAGYRGQRCGTHYFVISNQGLKLIHRILER